MAWIVEEEDLYKLRIEADENFTAFTYPVLLVLLNNPTSTQLKVWENASAQYEVVWFWNEEAVDYLKRKYPGALIGLEVQPGMLPASLTAADAIKHILEQVRTTAKADCSYGSLNLELLQMKYTPNANGSTEYFQKCLMLQNQVRELNVQGKITDEHIMDLAKDKFLESGHDKTHISAITARWDAKNSNDFAAFRQHYNAELRLLWENGDKGTNEREEAHRAEMDNIRNEQTEMRMEMANLTLAHDDWKAKYDALAAKTDSEAASLASTKISALTTESFQAFLNAGMDKAVKEATKKLEENAKKIAAAAPAPAPAPASNSASGQGGGPKRSNGRALPWRQYNKYCSNCGVNLHCNGEDCNRYKCQRYRTDDQPPHDTTATYTDKKGCSNKFHKRWMKWLNPNNNICETHGSDPIPNWTDE